MKYPCEDKNLWNFKKSMNTLGENPFILVCPVKGTGG